MDPERLDQGTARQRFGQYGLVAAALVLSSLFGLLGQALVAFFFGASADSDAFFMARDIALGTGKLTLSAQAVGVLVPMFLSMRSRDPDSWATLAAILSAALVVASPLALLLILFSGPLVDVFAPGFERETREETAALLRIVAPSLVLSLGAALAAAVLQGLQRFAAMQSASLAGGIALLAGFALLIPPFHVQGAALAFLCSSGVQFIVAWGLLVASGMPPLANPLSHRKHIRVFMRRTLSFMPYAAAAQAGGAVYRIAASLLETGAYAALALARQIYLSLQALLFLPLTTVLFPALAGHAAGGRGEELIRELRVTFRYAILIVAPASALLIVLSQPAVSAVFERGDFSAGDADRVALATAIYAATLPFGGIYLLLEQAAYAVEERRLVIGTNIWMEAVQGILYIGLTLALGLAGLPLAVLGGSIFAAARYARRLPGLEPGGLLRANRSFLLKVSACVAIMVALTLGVSEAIEAILSPSAGLAQLALALPAAALGLATYLLAAHALAIPELPLLGRLLSERLAGFRSR